MIKVAICPSGGHASSLVCEMTQSLKRPDTVMGAWDNRWDICDMPQSEMLESWKRRAEVDMDTSITINDNLVNLIHNSKKSIFLNGTCSRISPFLTMNSIRAMCIVRNPINSYVSLCTRQHLKDANEYFGGADTEECARWYIIRWNNIVYDFLESENPIVRFEYWSRDIRKLDVGVFKRAEQYVQPRTASTDKPISKKIEEMVVEGTREIHEEVQKFHRSWL
jgi:hypothetical protein